MLSFIRIKRQSLSHALTLFFLLTLFIAASLQSVHAQSDVTSSIDAAVAAQFKANEPGATIIVTRDGKMIFRKAYGMANLEQKTALTPEMTFRLGSVTKQFTAVAIMMLADQGKLAVSDDIRKYLPDYPIHDKVINIEHLLTHTSGIPGYTSLPGFQKVMKDDTSMAKMIDFFKDAPLQFDPGTRFEYSNSGYFLLGSIIEKVSGQTYAEFLAKNIFEPLGMQHTAYEGYERNKTKRVDGYSRGKDGYVKAEAISMGWPYAAGALVSNVDDLALWDAAISAGKLLRPATWKQTFTPYKLSDGKSAGYAYGWFIRKIQGHDSIEHGGGIPGFVTHVIRIPEDKVYVAILINQDSPTASPNYWAEKIAAIAIGKPHPELKAIALDTKTLDQFVGIYKAEEKNTLTISRVDGQLFAQRTGGSKLALQPSSETEFFLVNSFTRFKFLKNDKGTVSHLTIFQNGVEETVPRISDKPPAERQTISLAAAAFDAYVGEYQLAPNFILTITREGDKFMSQATGQGKLEIYAESETKFFLRVVDAQLQFVKDGDGKVLRLILYQGGREMPAIKIK